MFKAGNKYISSAPLAVINTLADELHRRGINLIRDIKESGDNIQFTCPYHNEGLEKRASCGVSVKEKEGYEAGTVHCFTCGTTTSLERMVSHCFGYNDEGSYGRKWLIRNFITFDGEEGRNFELPFDRSMRDKNKEENNYPEDLERFRFYHPYMYKRKLTDEVIEFFDIGYDKDTDSITFPTYDINNNLVFVGRRKINYKFYHYPKNAKKPVYGLNKVDFSSTDELIICESVFNALTCWVYGKKGVALLGLGTKDQYNIIKALPVRKLVLAFDGDAAGRRAMKKFKEEVTNKIITYYLLPEGKDINDLSLGEFKSLQEHYL